jgi:branched-chain amino acid transport system ATP-binding protein
LGAQAILSIKDLSVRYGKALAVDNVSLKIEEGQVTILVGANGAGKTSILNVISGLVPAASGEVVYAGKNIRGAAPHTIARAGLVHVPEGRRLFPQLTVLDNLRLGATSRSAKDEIKKDIASLFEHFPMLGPKQGQKAGSLSGGQQQILAIGRALMAKPRLLMLDEPCLGLAPVVIEEMYEIIRRINESGVSVLLAEQNVSLALRLGTYGYVLEIGKVTIEGDVAELKQNDMVSRAYLGE